MLNLAQVIGYLGRDPEVRYTTGGDAVCTISVATTEKWTDKSGEKQERTEWHRIVMFGRLAEVSGEYLKKGRLVYIQGKLQTREFEKDGVKKYTTEIVAHQMQMLGGGKSDGEDRPSSGGNEYRKAREGAPAASSRRSEKAGDFDDDIPF